MEQLEIKLLIWQIFFAISMFLLTFVSYLLPILIFTYRNRRSSIEQSSLEEDIQQSHHWSNNHNSIFNLYNQKNRWKRLLSYCNCISAGVFLGVCFLNLIPCVENEFNELLKTFPIMKQICGTFPLGQLTVICGLFLVLFLENLLSNCFNNNNKSGHNRHNNDEMAPVLYLEEDSAAETRHSDEHEELLLNSDHNNHHHHSSINNNLTNSTRSNNVPNRQRSVQNGNSMDHHVDHHGHHGHHHHDIVALTNKTSSMFSFFLLMFATSIHSMFEGLALGLQSNIKTAIHLFIGIALHECLVAIALGMNAIRLQQDNIQIKKHLKIAIFFSINIPFGNLLGILLGYTPGHIGQFISAIFQGFAAGTFIHVTFFELIPEEFIISGDHHHQQQQHHHNQIKHDHNQQNDSQESIDEIVNHQDQESRIIISQSSSSSSSSSTIIKISLLFLGFLIMAILAFLFSDE